jgi:hypothetical protein
MFTRSSIVTVAVAVLLAGSTLAQEYPPAFPRPTATKVFETDRIVVWDIVWPKGYATPMHRHVYDQVGTYYQTGGRTITTPDGTSRSTMTQVGGLSTTRKGTTHIEEGATDPPLRAVFIEMKKETGSGQPEQVSGPPPIFTSGAKPLLDDNRVVVWDYTWTPGGPAVRTPFTRDTVVVWLGTGTLRMTPERGAPQAVEVMPGTVRRYTRGDVESVEVLAGSPRSMIFSFK